MLQLKHKTIREGAVNFGNGESVYFDADGVSGEISEELADLAQVWPDFTVITPPVDPEVVASSLFESLVSQVKTFALEHGLAFWLKRGEVEIASVQEEEPVTPGTPPAPESADESVMEALIVADRETGEVVTSEPALPAAPETVQAAAVVVKAKKSTAHGN